MARAGDESDRQATEAYPETVQDVRNLWDLFRHGLSQASLRKELSFRGEVFVVVKEGTDIMVDFAS